MTHKDQEKDKDLNLVLEESLRTRTRINITGIRYWFGVLVTHFPPSAKWLYIEPG